MPAMQIEETREARFAMRMPKSLKASLERLAASDGRSVSNYIERVLTEHVEGAKARKQAKR